ncbi:deoxyribonuclease I [Planococcus antarcticus DSM 14505]|uniref:Deoxyribonuclease I n=1 Tax=Planococcus antarcticus DSM 14505 TaxID=1185653 RepID=A0ABM6D5Y5_9BACL|nr:endonuclease [Planococcus antarcticus]ANU10817.1 deoxyribonuclease I [Planococcus antarcticus DSM 14505]
MDKRLWNKSAKVLLSVGVAASLWAPSSQMTVQAAAPASDLFISEYIEGSNLNKAIEIYNGTGASIELSPYSLALYANGNTSAQSEMALSGNVASGDTVVLYHGGADSVIQGKGNLQDTSVINFNGDDALILEKDGVPIDSIGQVGARIENMKDVTLVRNPDIQVGGSVVDDAFDPSTDWIAYPVDTFEHLGSHTMDGFGETPAPAPAPSAYYETANGLQGTALKAELHEIIDDHFQLSYSQVWDALNITDEDPNNLNNVLLLYSGQSRSKSLNGGNVGDWNREHTWAKSHGSFGTAMGAGTDIHHLRPTDVQVNGLRGNLDFDYGGTAVSGCDGCLRTTTSWEPPDDVKGDVARMLFYMVVRYESGDAVDLELNDQVNNGSTPYHGKISVLLEWHAQDPVSAWEQQRNEKIEDIQGNRNPFIDHPEWAKSIW